MLQELYVQVTRRSRPGRLSHESAVGLVESFQRFPVVPITPGLVTAALETCSRFQISYWDAAILEAARSLGCEVVLSEDLSDGEDYGGDRGRGSVLGWIRRIASVSAGGSFAGGAPLDPRHTDASRGPLRLHDTDPRIDFEEPTNLPLNFSHLFRSGFDR